MYPADLGDGVTMRMFRKDDAWDLSALLLASKPTLRPWLTWVDAMETEKDSRAFIQRTLQATVDQGGLITSFAVLVDGQLAGTAGFHSIDRRNHTANAGYWLGSGFHGRGIMTKALDALLHYGFDEFCFHRIEIRAAVANEKSRALPERFGFVREGTLRQAEWLYDHFADHAVYGLLKSEWQQHQDLSS
ncbi:GNAT family N-acetyltransferase [Alkalicoccus chagannorensis]|uniref:GNAT family N-acetyltransferase n=1 Tax=Alkalicoccus chagannorensis TaxID=427072 RepID=UPI000420F0B7|nr:GNAT family protein [Alkalicoccus chagannorensis]